MAAHGPHDNGAPLPALARHRHTRPRALVTAPRLFPQLVRLRCRMDCTSGARRATKAATAFECQHVRKNAGCVQHTASSQSRREEVGGASRGCLYTQRCKQRFLMPLILVALFTRVSPGLIFDGECSFFPPTALSNRHRCFARLIGSDSIFDSQIVAFAWR